MRQVLNVDISKPLAVPFDAWLSGIDASNMTICTCYGKIETKEDDTFLTVVRKHSVVYFQGGNENTKVIIEELENPII